MLDLLKKVAGLEKFTEVYASTQKVRADRKGERKRKQALQVKSYELFILIDFSSCQLDKSIYHFRGVWFVNYVAKLDNPI